MFPRAVSSEVRPLPDATRHYDKAAHDRKRAELLPLAYNTPCPRCRLPMLKGQPLDLGHSTDAAFRPGRIGDRIEHTSCNRRAGAETRKALAKFKRRG